MNITSANIEAIKKINEWLIPKQQTLEFMIEDYNRSGEIAKDRQNLDKKEMIDWVLKIVTVVALLLLGGRQVLDLIK